MQKDFLTPINQFLSLSLWGLSRVRPLSLSLALSLTHSQTQSTPMAKPSRGGRRSPPSGSASGSSSRSRSYSGSDSRSRSSSRSRSVSRSRSLSRSRSRSRSFSSSSSPSRSASSRSPSAPPPKKRYFYCSSFSNMICYGFRLLCCLVAKKVLKKITKSWFFERNFFWKFTVRNSQTRFYRILIFWYFFGYW